MLGADGRRDSPRDTARLASFLEECRALGSLRGFKHFEVFMRGREEMVLCIHTKEKRLEPASLMPNADVIPVSLRDEDLKKDDTFIFLITGYPRYRCPYVYLRSSHEHLVQDEDKRMPVTLETSTAWRTEDIPLWRIIAEVITMVKPERINPFQIDMDHLDNMRVEEAVLLTGALLDFLCNMWVAMDPDKMPYMASVYEDIKALQTRHVGYLFEQASRK